jgi:hypothetical protein
VGEGRLWERLRIYSGKLFIAIKTSIVLQFSENLVDLTLNIEIGLA